MNIVRSALAAFVLTLLICPPGYSAEDGVMLGYVSVEFYHSMAEEGKDLQLVWLTGVMDGIMVRSIFSPNESAKDEETTWFSRCVQNHSLEQLKAIFDKYLKDHPEGWHVPAGVLAFFALTEFCESRGYKR